MQERYILQNKELWLEFVDLEKAFDRLQLVSCNTVVSIKISKVEGMYFGCH